MDMTETARSLLEQVPAHRTAGLRVVSATDGGGHVACEVPSGLANVIGSLHSSGLIALADAAGLAALIGACDSGSQFAGVLPLGRSATMSFLAPARGELLATCVLDDATRAALLPVLRRESGRARLRTRADISDATGSIVCRGVFDWSIRA